jgi:hypothetical protein
MKSSMRGLPALHPSDLCTVSSFSQVPHFLGQLSSTVLTLKFPFPVFAFALAIFSLMVAFVGEEKATSDIHLLGDLYARYRLQGVQMAAASVLYRH